MYEFHVERKGAVLLSIEMAESECHPVPPEGKWQPFSRMQKVRIINISTELPAAKIGRFEFKIGEKTPL